MTFREALIATVDRAPSRYNRGGAIEDLERKLDMAAEIIGKLSQVLLDRGILTEQDVSDIVSYDHGVRANADS